MTDRCEACGAELTYECQEVEFEHRGTYNIKEEVVVGYECSECGHKGEY